MTRRHAAAVLYDCLDVACAYHLANPGSLTSPADLDCIERMIRKQQLAFGKRLLEHIGGIEFEPGKGWTVEGEEGRVWTDGTLSPEELLDEDGA